MKKFICNRNGKAVFQEGDRELVAAYQMKSSPVVGGQNSWELGGVEMEFLRII